MTAHLTSHPVLYSFRRCPFAMRARLALAACGQTVELREIILRDKPAHMLEISPKGTVPVLWLQDGTVIDESLDVMRWAVAQADPMKLIAVSNAQQAKTDEWIALLDGPFKHHLDRYKYPNRYDNCDPLPHQAACLEILMQWAEPLKQSAWLFGDEPRFADFAILPFVRQCRIANPAWFDESEALAPVLQWLNRLLEMPLFNKVMTKFELWSPESEPVLFP